MHEPGRLSVKDHRSGVSAKDFLHPSQARAEDFFEPVESPESEDVHEVSGISTHGVIVYWSMRARDGIDHKTTELIRRFLLENEFRKTNRRPAPDARRDPERTRTGGCQDLAHFGTREQLGATNA